MLKKLFVVLVFALSLVLTSCGNAPAAEEQPAAPETAADEPAAEAPAEPLPEPEAEAPAEEPPAYVPGAQIVPPSGKTMRTLPADVVAEEEVRIASIYTRSNPFSMAVGNGQEFAKEILADRNCVVDIITIEDFDTTKWVNAIETAIAAGYDAIIGPGLSDALVPAYNKAVEQGIKVYLIGAERKDEEGNNLVNREAFFGQTTTDAGATCGRELAAAMGEEGKYGVITGSFAAISHGERVRGAQGELDKFAGIECIGEWENLDKMEEAYAITTNMLAAHPDLKGIYVAAGGPAGAAKAVVDAGKSGQVKIVCHDVLPEVSQYILDGTIAGALDQDPFNHGYQPAVVAFNSIAAGIVPDEFNMYEGVFATGENIQEYFPELFE